eukprot:TRINITY_DN35171_c0_g1_i1.p1 TRINITY_DN35171_c0_g1~~TRINITY_DN35171_c0_g1_i1.p1  ORF type:complete len:713 (-),score=159.08 TRINITY_DN35171_c0_g1_i1:56-2194(-)
MLRRLFGGGEKPSADSASHFQGEQSHGCVASVATEVDFGGFRRLPAPEMPSGGGILDRPSAVGAVTRKRVASESSIGGISIEDFPACKRGRPGFQTSSPLLRAWSSPEAVPHESSVEQPKRTLCSSDHSLATPRLLIGTSASSSSTAPPPSAVKLAAGSRLLWSEAAPEQAGLADPFTRLRSGSDRGPLQSRSLPLLAEEADRGKATTRQLPLPTGAWRCSPLIRPRVVPAEASVSRLAAYPPPSPREDAEKPHDSKAAAGPPDVATLMRMAEKAATAAQEAAKAATVAQKAAESAAAAVRKAVEVAGRASGDAVDNPPCNSPTSEDTCTLRSEALTLGGAKQSEGDADIRLPVEPEREVPHLEQDRGSDAGVHGNAMSPSLGPLRPTLMAASQGAAGFPLLGATGQPGVVTTSVQDQAPPPKEAAAPSSSAALRAAALFDEAAASADVQLPVDFPSAGGVFRFGLVPQQQSVGSIGNSRSQQLLELHGSSAAEESSIARHEPSLTQPVAWGHHGLQLQAPQAAAAGHPAVHAPLTPQAQPAPVQLPGLQGLPVFREPGGLHTIPAAALTSEAAVAQSRSSSLSLFEQPRHAQASWTQPDGLFGSAGGLTSAGMWSNGLPSGGLLGAPAASPQSMAPLFGGGGAGGMLGAAAHFQAMPAGQPLGGGFTSAFGPIPPQTAGAGSLFAQTGPGQMAPHLAGRRIVRAKRSLPTW